MKSCCSGGKGTSKASPAKKVSVGKMTYPHTTPKKMGIICKGSGTTNPDDMQR